MGEGNDRTFIVKKKGVSIMEGRSHTMEAEGSHPKHKAVYTSAFHCVHCRY